MFELIIALKPENLEKVNMPEKLVEWGGELFFYDLPKGALIIKQEYSVYTESGGKIT